MRGMTGQPAVPFVFPFVGTCWFFHAGEDDSTISELRKSSLQNCASANGMSVTDYILTILIVVVIALFWLFVWSNRE